MTSSEPLRFVVNRHRASTLHFDLRLEVGDVLVAWVVPRGPALDPAERRLAVRVGDHTFDHLELEGRSESGNGRISDQDRVGHRPLCAGRAAGTCPRPRAPEIRAFRPEGRGRLRADADPEWAGKTATGS